MTGSPERDSLVRKVFIQTTTKVSIMYLNIIQSFLRLIASDMDSGRRDAWINILLNLLNQIATKGPPTLDEASILAHAKLNVKVDQDQLAKFSHAHAHSNGNYTFILLNKINEVVEYPYAGVVSSTTLFGGGSKVSVSQPGTGVDPGVKTPTVDPKKITPPMSPEPYVPTPKVEEVDKLDKFFSALEKRPTKK